MRYRVVLLLIVLFISLSAAQNSRQSPDNSAAGSQISLFFGAAVGNYGVTEDKFNDIYPNRTVSRIYVAGIGNRSVYFVGKYREFNAHGKSFVENIAVDGKAEWKQKFYLAGVRFYPPGSTLYLDLLYANTKAEESITTENPMVTELTSSKSITNQGGGGALGLTLRFLSPVIFFGEVEYTTMVDRGKDAFGNDNPNIGGVCLSAGVFLFF